MPVRPPIPLDAETLREFCTRWQIRDLSLFGSFLRSDFREDSDLDLLVSFQPGTNWGYLSLFAMQDELEQLTGRKVDLVSRRGIEASANTVRRREILESAIPI